MKYALSIREAERASDILQVPRLQSVLLLQAAAQTTSFVTATGATDIREPSNNTADSVGLNKGGKDAHRMKKAGRAD